MENKIMCRTCGYMCPANTDYCPSCHASILRQEHDNEQPIDGIDISQWRKFIVKNSTEYIKLFQRNDGKKVFISFNGGAFFAAPLWMIYRKMYIQGFLTYLLMIAVNFLMIIFMLLTDQVALTMFIKYISIIAVSFIVSLFSKSMYKSHVKKCLSQPAPDMSRGGTSIKACFFWLIIFSLIEQFIYYPIANAIITVFAI